MAEDAISKRPSESDRAYWRRLRDVRNALTNAVKDRSLQHDALTAGRHRGISYVRIAHLLGVSEQWVHALKRSSQSARPAENNSLPTLPPGMPQREDYDDTLAYYAALRETREGIRERMPDVLRSAVREGDAEGASRTQIARELGVDPKWLRTQTQATSRSSAPPVEPS